jgi:hypothetical protein
MTVETFDNTSIGLELNKNSPVAAELQFGSSIQFAMTPKLRPEGSGFGSTWKKVTVLVVK